MMQFFKDIHIPDTIIQVGEVFNVLFTKGDFEKFLKDNKTKDLFFCANVDTQDPMRSVDSKGRTKYPLRNRASDIDITQKKYIYFDFDIRKLAEENGLKISDKDIKKMGLSMGEALKGTRMFNKWSYIVFTGNGIHIYYIDKQSSDINAQYFSLGYKFLSSKIQKIVGHKPDKACQNPARIARIPGSYNNKHNSKKKVEIIAQQDEKSNLIPYILKKGKEECKRKEEIQKFEESLRNIRKREGLYNTDEIIEKINRIPIEQEVLKDYPSWRCNGKNFFDTNSGMAAAYIENNHGLHNVLMIKESRWFAMINHDGVGTYLYRREMNRMNDRQAIEYFKTHYNII